MVLAKVLCVVLLLHWANVGDSRRFKNETISEKRTANLALAPHPHEVQTQQKTSDLTQHVHKMEIEQSKPQRPYAENYRGFLLYLLREVWRPDFCLGPYHLQPPNQDAYKELEKMNGLYFIFSSTNIDPNDIDHQDKIYPLYVGITGRNFAKRFTEHIKKKDGLVQKMNEEMDKPVPTVQELIAYVVDIPLPVAKFFESVFLSAFDFLMNVQENNQIRKKIQVTKSELVENGYKYFLVHHSNIKASLTDAEYLISENSVTKVKSEEPRYNFKDLPAGP